MGIFNQDNLDSNVTVGEFFKVYKPSNQFVHCACNGLVGTLNFQVARRGPYSSVAHPYYVDYVPEDWEYIDNTLICNKESATVHASYAPNFKHYGIEKIKADNFRMELSDYQVLPEVEACGTVQLDPMISSGRPSLEHAHITASELMITGRFILVNKCMFDVNKLVIFEASDFRNITGRIDEIRLHADSTTLKDRNWVQSVQIGPKKIRHLADVRAMFRNPSKYRKYFDELSTTPFVNFEVVKKSLGFPNINISQIEIHDPYIDLWLTSDGCVKGKKLSY